MDDLGNNFLKYVVLRGQQAHMAPLSRNIYKDHRISEGLQQGVDRTTYVTLKSLQET
jgi:hypothetical protein